MSDADETEPLTVEEVVLCAASWLESVGDGTVPHAEWLRRCREAVEVGAV
ncbi:hypothetical protein [Microterricola gilva]|nr:hypothetical protein [Microterricola gilva]